MKEKVLKDERTEKEKAYDVLLNKYYKMSYKDKNEILWEALDIMQGYNGRSRHDCIVIAMGGDYRD